MVCFKKITYAAVLLGASTIAWSGGESGFNVGGSLGTAGIDIDYEDVSYDDDDTAYKIFTGYNIGAVPAIDLAVELAYVNFGEASATLPFYGNVGTEVDGVDLFGLVGFNLGPIGLFGKVGAIMWDSETSTGIGSLSEDGTDAAYGVGARFQLGSVSLRAEYELFDIDEADIDFYSVGAAFTF